jgi:hypothetical protein
MVAAFAIGGLRYRVRHGRRLCDVGFLWFMAIDPIRRCAGGLSESCGERCQAMPWVVAGRKHREVICQGPKFCEFVGHSPTRAARRHRQPRIDRRFIFFPGASGGESNVLWSR